MASKWTNSTLIEAEGRSQRLDAWAVERRCPVQTIISRLKRGWSESRAVMTSATSSPSNRGKKLAAEILVGDEMRRLLDAGRKGPTSVRDRAIIVVCYRSGLRCCEVLALQPKDVDQRDGTIRILHGKGDKARAVAIDPQGVAIIQEWIAERDRLNVPNDAPLFCTRDGKQINARQVRAMMQRRGANAGLTKHVHLHGLRHTMASELANEGVGLLDIQNALGHSNASTTNRYLTRINPTSTLDAMRQRSWGRPSTSLPTMRTAAAVPPPAWLDDLRHAIGDRLAVFHDGRQSGTNDFQAIILLLPS